MYCLSLKNLQIGLYKKVFLFAIIFNFALNATYAQSSQSYQGFGAKILTDEEYAKLPKVNWDTLVKYSNTIHKFALKSISANESIVMLNTPPVGSQGDQGSCTAWAAGYAAAGILTYPKYNSWDKSKRSPSYVYNQTKVSSDCNSGSFMKDALNLIVTQGVCSWNLMPYNYTDCGTLPNSNQKFDASKNNASNWYRLDNNDLEGIKTALDLGYPVPIVCDLYQSFRDIWYMYHSDGIWDTNIGVYLGPHSTCIVGYDDNRQMVKVMNSWGISGGDYNNPGFYWIPYENINNNWIKEVYVLYGMNPAYPVTLSGSSIVCDQSTYTIANLPSGATVQWSTSNSNLTLISGQGSGTALFEENGNGLCQINATMSYSGNSYSPSPLMVSVGTPLRPYINNGSVTSTYASASYNLTWGSITTSLQLFFVEQPNSASAGDWIVVKAPYSNSFNLVQNDNFVYVTPNSVGTGSFTVKGENQCGVSDPTTVYLTIRQSGGGHGPIDPPSLPLDFAISPNPATDQVTVTLQGNELYRTTSNPSTDKAYEVQLWSATTLIKTLRTGEPSVQLPINTLPIGTYYIRVIYDGKVSSKVFFKR